jgi:hypothetical protein
MSDPLKRARKYRKLAGECLRLSELAPTAETKAEYRQIASDYIALGRIASRQSGQVADRQKNHSHDCRWGAVAEFLKRTARSHFFNMFLQCSI